MAGQQHPDVAIQSKYVLGLTKALSGGAKDAQKLCDEALASASTAGEFGLHSRALLAAAEAALAAKDGQKALSLATPAQEGSPVADNWNPSGAHGPLSRALTRY